MAKLKLSESAKKKVGRGKKGGSAAPARKTPTGKVRVRKGQFATKLTYTDEQVIEFYLEFKESLAETARQLGVSPRTLSERLKKIERRLKEEAANSQRAIKLVRSYWAEADAEEWEKERSQNTLDDALRESMFGLSKLLRKIEEEMNGPGGVKPFHYTRYLPLLKERRETIMALHRIRMDVYDIRGVQAFVQSVAFVMAELGPDVYQKFMKRLRSLGMEAALGDSSVLPKANPLAPKPTATEAVIIEPEKENPDGNDV